MELKRQLGLTDLVLLGINGVVGTGIFFLPGQIAAATGPWALAAYVSCGAMCLLIALCFAEMGSRYDQTGGAYLYAREAFGDFWGFVVGWIVWLASVLGWASVISFLAWMAANQPLLDGSALDAFLESTPGRVAVVAIVGVMLGLLNLRGTRIGVAANNVFSVAKLLPLALFVAVGLMHLSASPFVDTRPAADNTLTLNQFVLAMLAVVYMFSGFEWIPMPAGEVKDPQRRVPMALCVVLGVVVLVYATVHLVAQAAYPALPTATRAPLTDAARAFMGPGGASLIALGAMISIIGVNASIAFTGPRAMYALARDGYLPPVFSSVHARWGTPWAAIIATTLLVVSLPVLETAAAHLKAAASPEVARYIPLLKVETLVKMSALATLMQYVPTCLAVLVVRRRRDAPPPRFRVPLVVPVLALGMCLGLLSMTERSDWTFSALGIAMGIPLFFLARRRSATREL